MAQADLERSWTGRELADHCWLFRSPTSWTLVTMGRSVRYDDFDQPSGGKATITTQEFSTLEELVEEVERTYTSGASVHRAHRDRDHPTQGPIWCSATASRGF